MATSGVAAPGRTCGAEPGSALSCPIREGASRARRTLTEREGTVPSNSLIHTRTERASGLRHGVGSRALIHPLAASRCRLVQSREPLAFRRSSGPGCGGRERSHLEVVVELAAVVCRAATEEEQRPPPRQQRRSHRPRRRARAVARGERRKDHCPKPSRLSARFRTARRSHSVGRPPGNFLPPLYDAFLRDLQEF
jgi:hypothetical protein